MSTGSRYATLTRDELEARLGAAEDVCALYGWSPVRTADGSPSEKAAFEAWAKWTDVSGTGGVRGFEHLTDEVIAELAAQRDAKRASALRGLSQIVEVV